MSNGGVTAVVTPTEVEVGSRRSSPLASSDTTNPDARAVDELASLVDRLGKLGVNDPERFAPLGVGTLTDTLRWFDAQNGRVGVGVLVNELRAGGKPGWRGGESSLLEQQREYGERVCGWLGRHFPDVCEPVWGPHPAAVVAVIHLHAEHGKGVLRPREYGARIRAAVKAWEKKWA